MAGSPLTWEFRADNMRMRSRMTRDMWRLWPTLDFTRLDRTYPLWADGVIDLVGRYETEAAQRAGEYLTEFADEQGEGTPIVYTHQEIPRDQIDASLHAGSVAAVKRAVGSGKSASVAMNAAFSASSQFMARLVRDSSRDTVRVTSLFNDSFGGWRRVGTGDTCAFCTMLISRDAVYTESSVRFASHGNCNCEAEPADQSLRKSVDEYQKSDRTVAFNADQKQADKERVQAWLETNLVG